MHARTRAAIMMVLSLLAAIPTVGLCGCQAQRRRAEPPPPVVTREIPVFAGDASGVVAWDTLVDACANATVVLLGESHGHPVGLGLAADLFEDVLARNPNAVLSMEFYERDRQVDLDDYGRGLLSADEFDRVTFRNPGNNPPGHRRMVETARLAGRPIVASNAPRRYTKLARTDGYDALRGLTGEQRRLFEIPEPAGDSAYAQRFRAVMGEMSADPSHSMPGMDVEGFLRAQLLWDATMADSVADAIGLGAPVFHVVGRFHAEFGTEPGKSALADMIAQRLQPDQHVIIVTVLDEDARSLRADDVGRGHFVVYVGPNPPPETEGQR